MVIWHGVLHIRDKMRTNYLSEIKEANLINRFREQEGNLFYNIGPDATDDNQLIVCDAWKDRACFTAHDTSPDVDLWREIYQKYVVRCDEYLFDTEA